MHPNAGRTDCLQWAARFNAVGGTKFHWLTGRAARFKP
jgi:hypothetical protein